MSRHRVFADAGLEPRLSQFVASHVDGHSGFEVVDATEHEIHGVSGETSASNPIHEIVVVFHRRDVVVVRLDRYVGVDVCNQCGMWKEKMGPI